MRYPSDIYNYMPLPVPPEPSTPDEAHPGAKLTQAIIGNDIAAVRHQLEDAVARFITLRPSPVQLFVAAQHGNREMCQLLTAYGATWTAAEASILLPALDSTPNTQNFLRRFSSRKPDEANIALLLPLMKDLAAVYGRDDHSFVLKLEKIYQEYCDEAIDSAINKGDTRALDNIRHHDPDFCIDTVDFIRARSEKMWDTELALHDLRCLQSLKVPLSAIDLDTLTKAFDTAGTVILSVWLKPLHDLGLLQPDQSTFRHDVMNSYSGYIISRDNPEERYYPKEWYQKQITQDKAELAILCSSYYPVSESEAKRFITHDKFRNEEFLTTIAQFDYFSDAAFKQVDLLSLVTDRDVNALTLDFNFHASRRYLKQHPDAPSIDSPSYFDENIIFNCHKLNVMIGPKLVDVPPPGHYPHLVVKTPEPPPPPPEPEKPRKSRWGTTTNTGPR